MFHDLVQSVECSNPYSNPYSFFMDEWTSRHMTALQLMEPRTRDRSATNPTL